MKIPPWQLQNPKGQLETRGRSLPAHPRAKQSQQLPCPCPTPCCVPRRAQSHSPGTQDWAPHPESVSLWEMSRCGDRCLSPAPAAVGPAGFGAAAAPQRCPAAQESPGHGLGLALSSPGTHPSLPHPCRCHSGKIKLGLSPGAATSCRQGPHTGDSPGKGWIPTGG